jgi:hypothetical protein
MKSFNCLWQFISVNVQNQFYINTYIHTYIHMCVKCVLTIVMCFASEGGRRVISVIPEGREGRGWKSLPLS